MPIIEWKDCYLVGIQEIDQYHRHLVQYLNKSYDHFRENHTLDPGVLEILIDFSIQQFNCEERWMQRTCYPNLAAHKEEHRHFQTEIALLKKGRGLDTKGCVGLLWFLCSWVTNHMRESDAEFGRFLDSQPRRT